MPASSPSKCSKCGAVLLENQLGGLCPDCLGRRMFGADVAAEPSPHSTDGESSLRSAGPSGDSVGEIVPGRMIGRYRLLERIGEGGFGIVFLAEQVEPVKRQVALKVIKLGMDTEQVVARFEAERQALALMDHPNIARVLDGGATEGGRPYFVMELVNGIPITEFCDTHKCSTVERLALFMTVCQAVQHAHHKGIIHRDLKPSNILVSLAPTEGVDANAFQGIPKVIDFGIAKATQMELTEHTLFTGLNQFLGTPVYMSPEQLEVSAADVDTRSDIYSLGVLLYQLLTGRTPFEDRELIKGDYEDLRRTIREKDPPRPSTRLGTLIAEELATLARQRRTDASRLVYLLRGDLDWIVMKCLEKDRTRRYETANGLALDIQRHLDCEPVRARPPSKFYEFQKTVRRHKFGFAATAAIILVLAIGVTLTSIGFVRANRQKQRADQEAQNVRTVSYGAHLRSAIYLLDTVGNGGRALQELSKCPVQMRDWEWDYVRSRCDQTHRVIAQGLYDVGNAVFTPDGTKVLSCRLSGLYQLWDFQSGRELARFQMRPVSADAYPLPHMLFHGLRFTPDGKRVVLLDPTRIVVWNLATGEPLQTYTNVRPMAVHVGGHELLSLGWLPGRAGHPVIWDNIANQRRTSLNLPPEGSFGVNFTPDGRGFILGGGLGTSGGQTTWVEFRDVATGKRERTILTSHLFMMIDAALNQDHQLLATVSHDGDAKVFDLNAPEGSSPVHVFHTGEPLRAAALSHDGRRLAAGGTRSDILIWDISPASSNAEPIRLEGHASMIKSLCFSPDDRWILSASLDGSVRAWDAEPHLKHAYELVGRRVEDVVFSPDGKHLVSVRRDGTVQLWDAVTGQEMGTVGKAGLPIQEVVYSPDGSILAMLERDSGHVALWNTATWRRGLVMQESPWRVERIKFAGAYLAGYGSGNRVFLWDAKDGTLKTQYSLGETEAAATASAFSTDGKFLAVSLADSAGEVRVYHVMTGKLRQVLHGPGSKILALAFSPDATQVAAGAGDTTALVWDLPSGRLLHRLRGHNEAVDTVAFSSSGRRLLTGASDGDIRVWKLDTEENLISLPSRGRGNINLIRFSPDGRTIMAISSSGAPSFFQSFWPSWEVRRARRIVYLASNKVNELTEQLQSPEQVLEALRQDTHLAPEVKNVAVDIVLTRIRANAQQAQPAAPRSTQPPAGHSQ